ncbi:MAG TPA: hypothetical protein PKA63_07985 [Oligoflexia bacterium]|nr:hypothetical protein [Oligoflexia bacterium]HMP48589.1 hypothetical protein [Oligoflexia bacterium]
MYHLYLLVSLFSVMSSDIPALINFNSVNSGQEYSDLGIDGDFKADSPSLNLELKFSTIPQVNVGDPVLFNGSLVGNVSSINFPVGNVISDESISSESVMNQNAEAPSISIRINTRDLIPDNEFFGLVSSVKISHGEVSGSRSFVELLKLEAKQADSSKASFKFNSRDSGTISDTTPDTLRGFSSFEEFWKLGV